MLTTKRPRMHGLGRSKKRRLLAERQAMRAIVSDSSRAEEQAPKRAPLALRRPDAGQAWVDLIHHDSLVTVDVELLRQAVRFAFESGDAGGLLGRAVDDAPTKGSR